MSYPQLLLSNQLCFRVYALEKELMAAYRPLLDNLGLTYPQYITMLVLWEKKESTIGGICNALGLDTGTISPVVKRLEKSGFVLRSRQPQDERTVIVALTKAGAALEEQALGVSQDIASCLLAGTHESAVQRYALLRTVLDETLAQLRSYNT
jgi:MarR family transcriptional regulator, organic hydroperoxide resistance regulator